MYLIIFLLSGGLLYSNTIAALQKIRNNEYSGLYSLSGGALIVVFLYCLIIILSKW
ncbi:hypothetical protein [Clostridium sp.]|uniref:hypothetical protein n=1 Tax=Clostridium sp. TaxID=1506 RepID=UPI002FCB42C5